jgi:riboflavin kinase / FMN adenylyltransferase
MNIYRAFNEIDYNSETVLTVGTFDGVHLGHQLIINKLLNISEKNNLRHVLITIDPHPQIVLQKPDKKPIALLTTIEERLRLFERFGIQNTLIIPFTKEFAQTSPDEFVRKYLYKMVGIKKMLIGYDHLFGKNREGNEELLKKLSDELSFDIEKLPALQDKEVIISSTKIRDAISDKNIEFANEMLGYNYCVHGKILKGDERGAKIGYPTANIYPDNNYKLIPSNGIYLVSAEINNQKYYGMGYIGTRPTFTQDTRPTLEVNFFDFEGDIYNTEIFVEFLSYIRDDKKFDSIEALVKEIQNDERICRSLIGRM